MKALILVVKLVGLITYMRTDSVRMSPIFINDTYTIYRRKLW